MPLPRSFPFIPRSNRFLAPGQFWAIPFARGRFACGRVVELPPPGFRPARIAFLAGLSTWQGTAPPTEAALKGHTTFEQGVVHIKCILATGGTILGFRPLALDGIEPTLFLSQAAPIGGHVQRGFIPVRASTLTDRALPVFSHWGYEVIVALARKHFAEPGHGA